MNRPQQHFSIGDWSVFPGEGLLVRGPERKHLRPKTMDLLCLLASHAGRTVGKDAILDALWPDTAVEEGGLSRCVSELRSALEDDARRPRYVQTIPRRGYRVVARVEPLRPAAAAGRHRARWLAAALAAFLVAASLVTLFRQGESGAVTGDDSAPSPGGAPSGPRAAVLGIANLSGDPEADWLGGAFSHLLTSELAMTSDLRLIPQPVAGRAGAELALRDAPEPGEGGEGGGEPPPATALSRMRGGLAVDYVVSGHYVLSGEDPARQVSLDVVVTDTASGEIVAAAVASGPADEPARVARPAAWRLGELLGLSAPAREPPSHRLERMAQDLPPAYFRALLHLRRFETEAARSALERAIEEAPDAPWTRLALAETWSLQGYDRRSGEELEEALARAGGLEREDRLWFEARAHVLAGRWDEAVERLQALWLLDPSNLEYGMELASTLLEAGRAPEAEARVAEIRARAPSDHRDPRISLAAGEAALALSDAARALGEAEAAVEQARSVEAPLVEGRALHLRARALRAAGRAAEARADLEAARERFAQAGDRPREAAARLTHSRWLANDGEVAAAEGEARAALAISREIGNRSGEAEALRVFGGPVWERGRREEGEAALRESLRLSREIGDRAEEAATLNTLAIAVASFEAEGAATTYFEEALEIYRELGQRERVNSTLLNLGRAALLDGDPLRAIEALGEVEGMADALPADSRGNLLFNLGHARTLAGDLPGARRSFEAACELYRQLENPRMLAAGLEGLGEVRLLAGEMRGALADLEESLRLRRELGDPKRISFGEASLARALLAAGEPEAAERLVREALEREEPLQSADTRRSAEFALARVLLETGRAGAALEVLEDPRAEPLEKAGINDLGRRIVYGRALAAVGRHDEAEECLRAISALAGERGIETFRLEAEVALLELARSRGRAPDPGRTAEVARQARQRGLVLLARKAEEFIPPERDAR